MATRCTKCGTFLTDGERFCPNCGENAPQPVVTAPSPAPQQYSQPAQQAQGAASGYAAPVAVPAYNPAYQSQSSEEMSFGKWVGLVLLTNLLGIISIILLFVWGFGSGPKARQYYCRAMLILKAIIFVGALISTVIFASTFISFMESIVNSGFDYDSFYNEFYSEFAAFFSGLIH